ncbi:ferrous iron transport protein B [uncultured Alistipes sp.]|uniref:ferrous iron transport protein B n=1 Tax=uncultured Alistipes sp. TaxID=538949 RepID=UPI0026293454|nr:ferrous iron transport protein B [uncultured Alistipes sp.]
MRLSDLKTGESAVVLKVLGHGGFRRRIMEMGFVQGKRVEVVLNAPLLDPISYRIMDYNVSLRRSEAHMVVVITDREAESWKTGVVSEGTTECDSIDEVVRQCTKHVHVALVGNPNSGKTSLFNAISGGHEHVGNYSGVTVGAKVGYRTYKGYHFEITDLPGTYALAAYTPEEIYVRKHLADDTPDVIINAVVASNLERNLYLTTELIDINQRMVVALNMFDELEASGARLDHATLGGMLGVPMVPVVARSGRGIEELLDTVIDVFENRDDRVRHIHINQGTVVEAGLQTVDNLLKESRDELPKQFPPRYFAMKLLEGDRYAVEQLRSCERFPEWMEAGKREAKKIEEQLGEDVETALANHKYGFISGALKETFTAGTRESLRTTEIIDTFVTHKLWGFPIFFFLMWLMFYCTYAVGAYPQAWIEAGVEWLGGLVQRMMPDGVLKDLLTEGVIGGAGSVIVFLPNIMILYLFISFMEDSGYLARAAFIMDRVMHRMGLHGKSFIPLVMGFGCNVPAIMATRTIESFSSRLITILIMPFMSCSARMPIYILLVGAFFPSHPGAVMLGLYALGILLAMFTAKQIMRRFLFRIDETPFVMELPPYRMPTWRATLSHMWEKCAQYLRKMGGMILIASVIVWFLSYYPRTEAAEPRADAYASSYLGQVGKACEPVFEPLGLNWKAAVALVSGVAAKEIVVSTIGVLYAGEETTADADSEKAGTEPLAARLAASGDFTTASALAFLVFILIYFPCVATVSAIATEAGWRWAAISIVYNTLLAWIVSFLVYHLANCF